MPAAPSSQARPDTVVILAAGQGKRMKSARPKVLHEACGRPLLGYVVDQALGLEPERVIVVVGHGADQVRAALTREGQAERVTFVLQAEQRGTGHALQVCLPELGADPGLVAILYGDMPLVRVETLRELCALQQTAASSAGAAGAALLSAEPSDPRAFGRVLRDPAGDVRAIVEERDASPAERAVREVNLGVYAFPGRELAEILPGLSDRNAQREIYLTDVVGALRGRGRRVLALSLAEHSEAIGINTLKDLADARRALQERILEAHLENGVLIEDPATTYVDFGVSIGPRTKLLPCTVVRRGVTIGADCEVGPFTHLRAGTVLCDHAEVGNFTEAKQSTIGEHSKAKHLAYLGDATIGPHTNIGAGTIFANYDGKQKHPSVVGAHAFIGSGTIVVAPGRVGEGATTGAGAVVTKDIPAGETWIGVPAKPLVKRVGERAEPQRKMRVQDKKHRLMLVAGTSHPALAQAIADEIGVPLANAQVGRFPDGEIDVKINQDIRGADVFVLQPTCPPVNDNWIELLLLIDTLRRASASKITAVMPYYGYARKDRKDEGRVPISAKVVANTLVVSGADRLVTMDMHAAQIQGFYDIPVDHLYAKPALLEAVIALGLENPIVVTPDVGGTKMARAYAKEIDADLAIVDKRRISGSEIAIEHVIGDVLNRNVLIVDDMIATGGSIAEAARIVKEKGALQVVIAVTHAVLAGNAVAKLEAAPADRILITDTIPPKARLPRQAQVVSIAPLFARAIQAIHQCESVSSLFVPGKESVAKSTVRPGSSKE